MMLFLTLFIVGVLTVFLPCILPLIPIVLGVSITGRSWWRPLLTVMGMVVSFVGITFLLLVVLNQFVEVADYLRLGTYYILLLFGIGFLTHRRVLQYGGAIAGAFFFWEKGLLSLAVGAVAGIIAMVIGGWVASRVQQIGSDIQVRARREFGEGHPLTAFVIGLTMGLVWVPCAGPALGFAFALVREEPGIRALLLLTAYGLGTALPLFLIGYGGQVAMRSVRFLGRLSGIVKQVSGVLLIVTAVSLYFQWFQNLQVCLVNNTPFGTIGVDLEKKLFGEDMRPNHASSASSSSSSMSLPRLTRAPEFRGLGPWYNSDPLTLKGLKGKIVLVDFWTYSCINCIRTLPFMQGYWERFRDTPFVLLGVHSPEFVFEKSPKNVAAAIAQHGLTYPIAQDNDFETWRAFANRYWPAKYLIDADGYIRYTHFGEGAYEETEQAIESLLKEIGVDVHQGRSAPRGELDMQNRERTPETYLGERNWSALVNAHGEPTEDVLLYQFPSALPLHSYALEGSWQLQDSERQVLHSSTGKIRMHFLGGEINLVLGLEEKAKPVNVSVDIDGKAQKSFVVDHDDLYKLWKGDYGEHEIVLHFSGAGVSGYAFTFGS